MFAMPAVTQLLATALSEVSTLSKALKASLTSQRVTFLTPEVEPEACSFYYLLPNTWVSTGM